MRFTYDQRGWRTREPNNLGLLRKRQCNFGGDVTAHILLVRGKRKRLWHHRAISY